MWIVYLVIIPLSNNLAASIFWPIANSVPAGLPALGGGWRCDMGVSKSAAFLEGTAIAANAGLDCRAQRALQIERRRTDIGTLPRRRCDGYSRSIPDDATRPREMEPVGGESRFARSTAVTLPQSFTGKDRAGWSNESREVFAAWLLVLLAAAIAVLLLASRAPGTGDLSLPQWYDPPIAGAEGWAGEQPATDLTTESSDRPGMDSP
jgi:hypothetical protein